MIEPALGVDCVSRSGLCTKHLYNLFFDDTATYYLLIENAYSPCWYMPTLDKMLVIDHQFRVSQQSLEESYRQRPPQANKSTSFHNYLSTHTEQSLNHDVAL